MADVTLTYKGATIAELSASGSKTIETAGKYCEADILLEYVKPQGGGIVLPAEYQEVEWIANANTAYIDTLLDLSTIAKTQNPLTIELDAKFDQIRSSTSILVGASSSAGQWFGLLSSGVVSLGGGNNLSTPYSTRANYTIQYTGSGIVVSANGETVSRAGEMVRSTNILLFGTLRTDPDAFACIATIYSCKIRSFNNALLRDFVPCYRKADGVIGLYDKSSESFFTNSNSSGNFTKGADV